MTPPVKSLLFKTIVNTLGDSRLLLPDSEDRPRDDTHISHSTSVTVASMTITAPRVFWDESADDWSDTFLLRPVDEETFRLAIEDWAIWLRWEHAFHSGQTTQATHPALPDDRARHDELAAFLAPRLRIDPKHAIRVRGRFETQTAAQPGITSSAELVVVWSSHESTI